MRHALLLAPLQFRLSTCDGEKAIYIEEVNGKQGLDYTGPYMSMPRIVWVSTIRQLLSSPLISCGYGVGSSRSCCMLASVANVTYMPGITAKQNPPGCRLCYDHHQPSLVFAFVCCQLLAVRSESKPDREVKPRGCCLPVTTKSYRAAAKVGSTHSRNVSEAASTGE